MSTAENLEKEEGEREGGRGGVKLEGNLFHFEVVVIAKERQAWVVFIIVMFVVKSLLFT